MGKQWKQCQTLFFFGSKITADGDSSHEIQRHLLLGRKVMTNLDSIFKSRDITLSTKVCLVKATSFPSSHVWMWELDYKESWAPKNWCFRTVVLEKTLESPLDSKDIKPVNPKANQPWLFIGRTGRLLCCTSWGHKESDMTEQLNNNWIWGWVLLVLSCSLEISSNTSIESTILYSFE